jgi:hypothetical protein
MSKVANNMAAASQPAYEIYNISDATRTVGI